MADHRLQVFYAVARAQSFTKAAHVLAMTQPAVTFQIRQLEERLRIRLFDRSHNRIRLTEVGALIYAYTERIVDLYAQMEHAVGELTNEVSGVVMLGASTTVAEYLLPSFLGEFKKTFPQVTLRLQVANTRSVVSMVEANAIDIGIIEGPVPSTTLAVEGCRVDELVAVVPTGHRLAEGKVVRATDLIEQPYVAREAGSGTREVVHDYLTASGLNPEDLDVVMELGSPEAIKAVVVAGLGISVLSQATLSKELALGWLVAVPLEPPLRRQLSFVYQKDRFRTRPVEELMKFAHSRC